MFEQQEHKLSLIAKIVIVFAIGAGTGVGSCGTGAILGRHGGGFFFILGAYLFWLSLLGLVLTGAAWLIVKFIGFFNT